MKVSIVIVNYNTKKLLLDCLASVYQHIKDIAFEVIVVDNASADGSAEAVKEQYPAVRLVESEQNLGFGQANNLGCRGATGEYLFFLNSDTVLLDNALLPLVAFMDSRPDCGIAGGNLVDSGRTPVHSYGPVLPSPFSDLYRFLPNAMRLRYGKSWCYNYTGKPMEVGYITGADLLIRREIFDSIGAFHPAFFMYYEETELTSRVRKAGYSVWSVPEATIVHIKGASLEFLSGAKQMVFESKYRYLRMVYGTNGARLAHLLFRLWCNYKRAFFALLSRLTSYKKYTAMLAMEEEVFRREIG